MIIDHASKHRSDFVRSFYELFEVRFRHIATVACKVQPGPSFSIFAVSVRQFTHEMRVVPTFRPRLSQVRTHGPGRAAYLVGQRILFLLWKAFARVEYLHR
jgi:hypothetical protein